MSIFEHASAFIELHGAAQIALVNVVETSGSTPRHRGTRMLVAHDGDIFQTIGGGRVEKEVIELAQGIGTGSIAQVVTHHLVRDLAMCCGGSMTFLIEPLERSMESWVLVSGALGRREAGHLTSSLDAPLTLSDELCGTSWDGRRFEQDLVPRSRVLLFGAGHIGQALFPLLQAAEFEVVLCDDNELGILDQLEQVGALSGPEDSKQPIQLVPSFELSDVRRQVGELGLGDYAIIVTRDHAIDQRLVEAILAGPELSYVGLIGSHGKVGRFRRRILAKGALREDQWERLEAPMGLDIGAETPIEIAISIAGRIVGERSRQRKARSSHQESVRPHVAKQ